MEKNDTPDGFARKVERIMAETAGVRITNHTSHDAFEFAKRHLLERAARASSWNSGRGNYAFEIELIFAICKYTFLQWRLIRMLIWQRE